MSTKNKETKISKVVGVLSSGATSGGIGAVASTMSAAEITQILATIGKTVGGGMGAGIGIVSATPFAVGGAAAYGTKKYTEHLAAKAAARSSGNLGALAAVAAISLAGFAIYKIWNAANQKCTAQSSDEINTYEATPLLVEQLNKEGNDIL